MLQIKEDRLNELTRHEIMRKHFQKRCEELEKENVKLNEMHELSKKHIKELIEKYNKIIDSYKKKGK